MLVHLSVSYTHLDVYKRQEQKRTEYGDDQADTYDKAALEPHCYHQYQYYDDDGFYPVSYTHLVSPHSFVSVINLLPVGKCPY